MTPSLRLALISLVPLADVGFVRACPFHAAGCVEWWGWRKMHHLLIRTSKSEQSIGISPFFMGTSGPMLRPSSPAKTSVAGMGLQVACLAWWV